jgi:2-(1,2-epoxy-1,2-dihydrophenyl)acetyl-CoA isomerase
LGEAENAEAFAAASSRINADRTIKVAILTGAGSVFSAGGHLKMKRARLNGPPETRLEIRARYRKTVHALVRAMWGIEVPLITAVNGRALGLGNDVACLGDIRISAESATFGAPIPQMGLVPGDRGLEFWRRRSARHAQLSFCSQARRSTQRRRSPGAS